MPLLVVKGGAEGSHVVREGDWLDCVGFPIEAVDPTGAGDAFDAGFLYGFLSGRPLAECAVWGNACGALTAAQPGGSGAFSGRAEVESFIRAKTQAAGQTRMANGQ